MLVLPLGKLERGDEGWDVLNDWYELWICTRTRTHNKAQRVATLVH